MEAGANRDPALRQGVCHPPGVPSFDPEGQDAALTAGIVCPENRHPQKPGQPLRRLLPQGGLAAEDAGRTFLDVGCGSGILAIAAALEGFREVRGFDNDPDAVRNANENAAANGLGALFFEGDLSAPDVTAPADVVAANVLAPVLVRFAREVGALVNPGGRLILSGILDEQYAEVRDAYAALGFAEISSRLIGEWRTGLFSR